MRLTTVEKIGFFHCVEFTKGIKPTERLQSEMERWIQKDEKGPTPISIRGSLIVLPEAFNIDRYERQSTHLQDARECLEDLQGLAREHQVVFVAGILDRRINSAYMVDADVSQLMCHKVADDLVGLYDPCTGEPDACNPIVFQNACVGALICLDAIADATGQPAVGTRLKVFTEVLKARPGRKIVCVPARFADYRAGFDLLSQIPECWHVLAEGRDVHMGSFINDSKTVTRVADAQKNAVEIRTMPSALKRA